jgi:hypothetical protein
MVYLFTDFNVALTEWEQKGRGNYRNGERKWGVGGSMGCHRELEAGQGAEMI